MNNQFSFEGKYEESSKNAIKILDLFLDTHKKAGNSFDYECISNALKNFNKTQNEIETSERRINKLSEGLIISEAYYGTKHPKIKDSLIIIPNQSPLRPVTQKIKTKKLNKSLEKPFDFSLYSPQKSSRKQGRKISPPTPRSQGIFNTTFEPKQSLPVQLKHSFKLKIPQISKKLVIFDKPTVKRKNRRDLLLPIKNLHTENIMIIQRAFRRFLAKDFVKKKKEYGKDALKKALNEFEELKKEPIEEWSFQESDLYIPNFKVKKISISKYGLDVIPEAKYERFKSR
ncbi:unnamed protein product [Blepharisma stoltei]|uniref:Uncharacterized protein n=1 Tax=Blepharisma stoltei TaxID=1481888 RepID=A0AAU9KEF6_9CILI|nr:unnamed protein product [Blepharisma stoltei]